MIYYCFDEIIYESPHSTLYRAFAKDQTRQVVLKCFETDAQGAYLREMSGFGVDHPNLVTCLDTFYLGDNRPCMVHEFFQDGTLGQWLSAHGKADADFCYRCLEDVLQALQYLNENKRIHCDIKPGNIFLRLSPAQPPRFVLGDLGATCSLREAQESRYGVGTPAYIAPERLYDRFFYNSDLYSLGIVAFELLTGERPFLGMPDEIKRAHLSKLPDLEKITDLSLRDFIERLLEKDPELRIADAKTALVILNAIRQGERIAEPVKISNRQVIQNTQQIVPTGFGQQYQLNSNGQPNKLLLFEVNNQVIVGLEHDSHIDLINPDNNKQDVVLKNGVTQQQSDSFFYTSSVKVFQFDLRSYQRQLIYSFNKNISYFQINGDYLLLRSKYDTVYCHLHSKQVYKFSQPHYFSNPIASVLANGNFCLSGGTTNQELILRDEKTAVLAQWQLQGPILAMASAEQSLLALTLDIENSARYWLSCLSLEHEPRYLSFSNEEIVQYCQTQNTVFWLNSYHQLYMCSIDLNPKLIAQLPTNLVIEAFQLSENHRWLVIFIRCANQKHQIICFKADGE
jgi:serine/threonine protein kinase